MNIHSEYVITALYISIQLVTYTLIIMTYFMNLLLHLFHNKIYNIWVIFTNLFNYRIH